MGSFRKKEQAQSAQVETRDKVSRRFTRRTGSGYWQLATFAKEGHLFRIAFPASEGTKIDRLYPKSPPDNNIHIVYFKEVGHFLPIGFSF